MKNLDTLEIIALERIGALYSSGNDIPPSIGSNFPVATPSGVLTPLDIHPDKLRLDLGINLKGVDSNTITVNIKELPKELSKFEKINPPPIRPFKSDNKI